MKTILIIEDNEEIRENTAEILELADYQVLTAPNGKVGVELAKAEKPDLIICDIMMPELDGYGVLRILSKSAETASIPFIFLTAKAEKDDFRKGMNLGADDYITKPFDDLTLLDAVEIRLRKHAKFKQEAGQTVTNASPAPGQGNKGTDLKKLLTDARRTIAVKKKHQIYQEGRYANALYYITRGSVKTYKTNQEGREFITGLHKPDDFIGYLDLMKEGNYSESAMALEDAELCVINQQDFFNLIHTNQEVAIQFIKMLSRDVADREATLLKLAYNSVRKRVAESLVILYRKYCAEGQRTPTISVSREDLSSLAGASKETVIRTLSDFKDEKLINISGRSIQILDLQKLERMKN
jgi:CRP-like cAMP-binding protein/CheY-like chemotaxis protein